MTEHKPGLALVGAGYWGKNLARNFHTLGALGVLCDLDQSILDSYGPEYAGVKKTGDFASLLADGEVTAVAIAAPAAAHYRLAKAALKAGKDVYVEKPLCLAVNEGEELVELARTQGRILMVGHLLQYHPCIRKLQEMVAAGELGKLCYMVSNRMNLGKFRKEENALWSFAPHDISVLLSLAGSRLPETVRCVGEAYLTDGVPDCTLTTLAFAGRLKAHIHVSWLNPFKEQKLTLVGTRGMAVFDDTQPWAGKLTVYRDYLTWTDGQTPVPNKVAGQLVEVIQAEPLREECAHFLECCRTRSAPRTDGAEGLRVLRVLRAAQESLDTRGDARGCEPSPAAIKPAYFAHSTAIVDAGAVIGAGTKVWHFAHISAGATLGERCNLGQNTFVAGGVAIGNNVKIQNNVSLYAGTTVEDDVFLGPSCVLTNVTNPRSQVSRHSLYEPTVIRRGATVGANATIVCGVTLGRYAFIAAGAVVTKDVPDYALMAGVPARQQGWMSRHGHHLKDNGTGVMTCPETGFRYQSSNGTLRCLDLDEDAPLPADLAVGRASYDELKAP